MGIQSAKNGATNTAVSLSVALAYVFVKNCRTEASTEKFTKAPFDKYERIYLPNAFKQNYKLQWELKSHCSCRPEVVLNAVDSVPDIRAAEFLWRIGQILRVNICKKVRSRKTH